MSAKTIKAASAQLLQNNLPQIKSVTRQYQRMTPEAASPRVILWDSGGRQRRAATGLLERDYRLETHLVYYGTTADDDGSAFEDLTEAIMALYQTHQTLEGQADTPTSKVLKIAAEMEWTKAPPELVQARMVWQAILTVMVTEVINA